MSSAASQTVNEKLFGWLALTMTPQLGPTRSRRLVERLGKVENIFRTSLTELEACGLPASAAQSLALGASRQSAEQELARVASACATLMCYDDPDYPEPLKNIYDPPVILYIRRNRGTLTAPGIAVVGTRHPTPYGLGMAERLSCDLSARGLIIFSGLARGSTPPPTGERSQARGQTVGVLGTGVDVVYPRENKKLADQMLEAGGALISEFPMGTSAAPQNFPIRTASSAGYPSASWSLKPASIAEHALPHAALWSNAVKYLRCQAT